MAKQSPRTPKRSVPKRQPAPAAIKLRSPLARPLQVQHLAVPPRFVRPKRIHPRRTLPLVKEGTEREFHSLTRQVAFHRPLAMAAAADEITLVTSTELTSPGEQRTASNVGEPSVAINGQVVFYTC